MSFSVVYFGKRVTSLAVLIFRDSYSTEIPLLLTPRIVSSEIDREASSDSRVSKKEGIWGNFTMKRSKLLGLNVREIVVLLGRNRVYT